MKIERLLLNAVPLCSLPNCKLICYQRGCILVLNNGKEESRFPFPINYKERFLGWSRLATRLLRFGIRAAVALDNEHIVLSKGSLLVELNLCTAELSKGWFCEDGVRPLFFTSLNGLSGFDDGVYFGGYFTNMGKKPVHVYRRIALDKWEIVFTFPQGAINHVHNLVADPYRNCLWAFTGDFEEASAIWKITDNFKTVERVACNNQQYRGCVVYALPDGLLYATDAPFTKNFIYLLSPETMELKEIYPIHGSCIYGCQWNDKFVFSSTVEGDGRDESLWEFCFGRKRGAGIVDENVHLYVGTLSSGFKDVCAVKKDWLPFLFQFGVFRLPSGQIKSEEIFCQMIGTVKYDLSLVRISDFE